MLRLAGFSSGRGDCARGGCSAGDAVRARGCVRSMPVVRFYWDVLAFVRACHTFLSGCLMFDHACCLPHSAKQDGLRYVPFLFRRGSRSPFVRSRVAVRLSNLAGSLRVCAFLYGDPDGERKGRGNAENGGNGERSRRRGRVRFCVTILALSCFPRGVRWGLRAPKPAPKSHWLSGLSSFGS